MKSLFPRSAALALALALLAGCSTRSISNSAYDEQFRRYGSALGNYRGELSELDVVGVTIDAAITEADIRSALAESAVPRLTPQSRVLLIQSGAEFPDDRMIAHLGKTLAVQPFSGKPPAPTDGGQSYSKALRLAAARGGLDKIVCYWGVLESEQTNHVTKIVSWVPVAGSLLPDQTQSMRIRLKAIVVDVATGRWTFVSPPSAVSSSLSSIVTRRNTDQTLVAELKENGYRNLAQALTDGFAG